MTYVYRYWGTWRSRQFLHTDLPVKLPGWNPNPRWPEWFTTCKPGDVVLLNGTDRVIREVSRAADLPNRRGVHPLSSFWLIFSIMRCSWTERGYTCYQASDLLTKGISHTGCSVPLTSRLDLRIARELRSEHMDKKHRRKLVDCCDVAGVIR